MSKAILMSIKPEYCLLIATGRKTVELRKILPADIKPPYKVYIYCTKGDKILIKDRKNGVISLIQSKAFQKAIDFQKQQILNGKVIGEYVCDKEYNAAYPFELGSYKGMTYCKQILEEACLTEKKLEEYAKGKDVFGMQISDLVIYDEPKELNEFKTIDRQTLKNCPYRERYFTNPDWTNGASLPAGYCCYIDIIDVNFCRPYENEVCECLKSLLRPPQFWCYVKVLKDGIKE